ncbi:hypothetical protein GQ54DRAFT_295120 [Martensiomyces pterosporus]|nr:hypothetical protein GQ54DRAFT_295120 [Martensiomyces pterosporus]
MVQENIGEGTSRRLPDRSAKECELIKIVQYTCEKSDVVVCKPLVRLFKRCPGVPSVELVQDGDAYIDIKTHEDVFGWKANLGHASEA